MSVGMTPQYFYRRDEFVSGPVPFGKLVSLAREKSLNLEDVVRSEEDSQWNPAAEISGLFHMAGRAEEVSRWRAERRKKGSGQETEDVNEKEISETAGEESPELRREIQAATYEAALQWQAKRQQGGEAVAGEVESRLRTVWGGMASGLRKGGVSLLSLPFVLISATWARTRIDITLPKWLERFLDVLFSKETVIVGFRWGMTLAVPNLVAWGIFSWSNMEAQRYPSRNPSQVSPKMFPGWGACSSEGEYLFLLIDMMLIAAVATYIGIRWLEAKADD